MLLDSTQFQKEQSERERKANEFKMEIETLAEQHNQIVRELQAEHKREMEAEMAQTNKLAEEIQQMKKKHEEILTQIKDDASDEIEQIQKKNKGDLNKISDLSLKSKADLQLTKNKNHDLETEIDQLKRDIQDRQQQLNQQQQQTEKLQLEIAQFAAEIKEKDKTIGDRERKIYQLKKKTQELEKFKFVLDYKIKELMRDIAPREQEITKLQKLTNDMDKSLKKYNRVNANLGIIVDDLRERQENMQQLIKNNRSKIRANSILIKGFKDDVYDAVQFIDSFIALQKRIAELFEKYVKDKDVKTVDIDPDIQKEYENQKKYLENSANSLKKKLTKDSEIHKQDNYRIMKENIDLIDQINDLRRLIGNFKSQVRNTESTLGSNAASNMGSRIGDRSQRSNKSQVDNMSNHSMTQSAWAQKELSQKRQRIEDMRNHLAQIEEDNQKLKMAE